MKQLAFGTLYGLVGLVILSVTLVTVDNSGLNNPNKAEKIQVGRALNFTPEMTTPIVTTMTSDDLQTMTAKISFARSVLEDFWTNEFARNGLKYYSPGLKLYRGQTNSACGYSSDARYCSADRTIYLNLDFLYSQMNNVSRTLGSDGDMAAIVVIAHEYGHHTQTQVPIFSRLQELNADCMAGAFTRYSALKGVLDSDDIAEARNGLANNPDDEVSWFNTSSHGTSAQRVAAFDNGYSYGVGYCR